MKQIQFIDDWYAYNGKQKGENRRQYDVDNREITLKGKSGCDASGV